VWSQTLNASNFFYFYAHTSTDPDGGPVTNGISVYWWNSGGTSKLGTHSTNNVLTLGQWSYVAITYDASQPQSNRFTIYVNGVDVTDRTDIGSAGTIASINPTNIRVGSDQPFGEYLNGSVDEVRFYKRLLTAAEVVTDMNTPMAPGGRMSSTITKSSQADQQDVQSKETLQPFEVTITPNPSTGVFNLTVLSPNKNPVTIRVLDISGRTVMSPQRIAANSSLRIGNSWTVGTYFVEVVQGNNKKVMKMMKTQ
jgi:hypothetical protein